MKTTPFPVKIKPSQPINQTVKTNLTHNKQTNKKRVTSKNNGQEFS